MASPKKENQELSSMGKRRGVASIVRVVASLVRVRNLCMSILLTGTAGPMFSALPPSYTFGLGTTEWTSESDEDVGEIARQRVGSPKLRSGKRRVSPVIDSV
ncbi:hypothetical protein COCNU_scaffold005702G000010 [Cocos nucifera]|nr:hypothetical protein [Cocos nucifera]